MIEKLPELESLWSQVIRLSAIDKMRLVERVAVWFEDEMVGTPIDPSINIGWGAQIVQDIKSGQLDTSEWVSMDIDDPVQWVKELRQKEQQYRESRL